MTLSELAFGIDPSMLALIESFSEATSITASVSILVTAGVALVGATGLWRDARHTAKTQKDTIDDLVRALAEEIDARQKADASATSDLETHEKEQRQWQQQHFTSLREKVIRIEAKLEHDRPRSRSHQESRPR